MSKHDDGSAMMAGVGITAASGVATAIDAGIEGTFEVIGASEGWFGKIWGAMIVPMMFITWGTLWWNGVSLVVSAWTGVGSMFFMAAVWGAKFRKRD